MGKCHGGGWGGGFGVRQQAGVGECRRGPGYVGSRLRGNDEVGRGNDEVGVRAAG